jgi:hypothetical protein
MTGRKRPLYAENDLALARALGVLSIGLGLVDLFARRAVSGKTGVRTRRWWASMACARSQQESAYWPPAIP